MALRLLAAALAVLPRLAIAQVNETYPAPFVFGDRQTDLTPAEIEAQAADPTPFGVAVETLVVVDTRESGLQIVSRAGRSAVDTSLAGAFLQTPEFRARMQRFIGQPLSFKLIAEIQAEITQYHRENNRPLVSVTIPPQEVSDAGLQVNVVPFALGRVRAEGNTRTPDETITGAISVDPGEVIDTEKLIGDINWLGLNPFRSVSSVFAPGEAFGLTDLILQVDESRPWSGYAGLSNTGTAATYEERVYAGVNAGLGPSADVQLSYLFTASPDNIGRGALFDNGDEKGYLAHSAGLFVPIETPSGRRSKLTLEASYLDLYSDTAGLFTAREKSLGAGAELAFPLGFRTRGGWSSNTDVYGRLEYASLETTRFFSGTAFDARETSSRKMVLGVRRDYSGTLSDRPVQGLYDIGLSVGRSVAEDGGRRNFAYLRFNGETAMQAPSGASWRLRYAGQLSDSALSSLDQFAVGGAFSVRGYDTNAVSGSSGAWAAMEVASPPVSLAHAGLAVRPYAFLDMGYVAADGAGKGMDLASAGAGLWFDAANRLELTFEVARTLSSIDPGGDNQTRLHVNMTARF